MALLLLGTMPGPVRAQDPLPPAEPAAPAPPEPTQAPAAPRVHSWESSASFEIQTFRSVRTDWYRWSVSTRRKFDGGSVAAEISDTRRFDLWDEAAAIDVWKNLWAKSYVNARVQVAYDAEILPRLDLYTELFQGIGKGWEVSGSYRHMDFPGNNADIYAVTLGKYLGNWYFRARASETAGTGGRGASYSVWVRKFLAKEDDFVEVGMGTGREVVSLGERRQAEARENTFYSLRAQYFFSDRVGLSASLGFGEEEKAPRRIGYGLSLILRW